MNFQQERQRRSCRRALSALALSTALVGCGGGERATDATASAAEASGTAQIASVRRETATTTAIAQPANTEGRLLASNCFQCHGTGGTGGFDSILGSEAREVLEFMTKTANRDIMAAHAQGYTPEQLQKVIAYLQQ